MPQRLLSMFIVTALASTGCFFARGEVVFEELTEGPLGAPPLPKDVIGGGDVADPGDGPRQVEPQPGVIDAQPIDWETASIDRDAMTITLTWWSGVEPCTVLDRIDIEYGDEAVTVTVFEGAPENAAAVSCIAMAEQKQATVDLEEDIGQRTLVDGAEA